MNKKLKFDLIKQAQLYLIQNPQDYLHDITHHYRTFLIAKDIKNNINEIVDDDLLEVFCWWHDVKIPELDYKKDRVAKVIAKHLSNLLPQEYKENVLDSIENHEFGSKPNFIEGKILQDADKLETLSVERIRLAMDAVDAELLNKNATLSKFNEFIENWIPKMPERYNFEYSKLLHLKLLEECKPEFEKLKEYFLSN